MNAQSSCSSEWQLSALLREWVNVSESDDVVVTGVSQHSSDTSRGDLFLATAGENSHGLQYCADAISNGAAAIAWEPVSEQPKLKADYAVPAIEFHDLSKYIGEITTRCYGDLTTQLKIIAITGTDGKSSVAHLLAQALEHLNKPCGLIGTLGYGRLSTLSTASHTTPPITRLAKEMHKFACNGCEYVAMEASSHGIAQNRLQNLNIHTAVLTNITRDHLDYHSSIEEYVQTKAQLFFGYQPNHVVLNIDDAIGMQWSKELHGSCKLLTYSFSNADADVFASNIKYNAQGASLNLHVDCESHHLQTSLLGEFNVLNVLAVTAVLLSLQFNIDDIVTALTKIQPVPGRMQVLNSRQGPSVIVDYAHTPAALTAAINATRKHFNGKVICVFGCGGDRDTGKRPEMGAAVTSIVDVAVITSDNPRNEDPDQIIKDIVAGCCVGADFITITDREDAITQAIQSADKQDVILIAGKGHEQYQQIGNTKHAFDDVQVATRVLNQLNG